jgi:hypothetical protein
LSFVLCGNSFSFKEKNPGNSTNAYGELNRDSPHSNVVSRYERRSDHQTTRASYPSLSLQSEQVCRESESGEKKRL